MIKLLFIPIVFFSIFFYSQYTHSNQHSAKDVVHIFYVWHLQNEIKKVMSVSQNEIYSYVNACTIKKQRAELARGTIGSDYFTDSQDPDPAWIDTMVIHDAIKLDDNTSMVIVSFNPTAKDAPRLSVFLQRESGTFYITKIVNLKGFF
jgi:hypothetical protein